MDWWIPERDTPEWVRAWAALEAAGQDIAQFMLMSIEGDATKPQGEVACFKHSLRRETIRVALHE